MLGRTCSIPCYNNSRNQSGGMGYAVGERLLVAAAVVLATVCEILDVFSKAVCDKIFRLNANQPQQR